MIEDDEAIDDIIALRQRVIDFLGPPRRYISDYDLACFLKAEAKYTGKISETSITSEPRKQLHRRFTQEEDEQILSRPEATNGQLALSLNRSRASIKQRKELLNRPSPGPIQKEPNEHS